MAALHFARFSQGLALLPAGIDENEIYRPYPAQRARKASRDAYARSPGKRRSTRSLPGVLHLSRRQRRPCICSLPVEESDYPVPIVPGSHLAEKKREQGASAQLEKGKARKHTSGGTGQTPL